MKVEYSLLVLVLSLVFALVKKYLPDIPLDQGLFNTFVLYALAKLGVEVVGKPFRSFMVNLGFSAFEK